MRYLPIRSPDREEPTPPSRPIRVLPGRQEGFRDYLPIRKSIPVVDKGGRVLESGTLMRALFCTNSTYFDYVQHVYDTRLNLDTAAGKITNLMARILPHGGHDLGDEYEGQTMSDMSPVRVSNAQAVMRMAAIPTEYESVRKIVMRMTAAQIEKYLKVLGGKDEQESEDIALTIAQDVLENQWVYQVNKGRRELLGEARRLLESSNLAGEVSPPRDIFNSTHPKQVAECIYAITKQAIETGQPGAVNAVTDRGNALVKEFGIYHHTLLHLYRTEGIATLCDILESIENLCQAQGPEYIPLSWHVWKSRQDDPLVKDMPFEWWYALHAELE